MQCSGLLPPAHWPTVEQLGTPDGVVHALLTTASVVEMSGEWLWWLGVAWGFVELTRRATVLRPLLVGGGYASLVQLSATHATVLSVDHAGFYAGDWIPPFQMVALVPLAISPFLPTYRRLLASVSVAMCALAGLHYFVTREMLNINFIDCGLGKMAPGGSEWVAGVIAVTSWLGFYAFFAYLQRRLAQHQRSGLR